MVEAEAYHGPSLIIAYAPCINHGINMGLAQAEIKKAVECGYWTIYRYNPELAEQGKNPLTLDSKEPKAEAIRTLSRARCAMRPWPRCSPMWRRTCSTRTRPTPWPSTPSTREWPK